MSAQQELAGYCPHCLDRVPRKSPGSTVYCEEKRARVELVTNLEAERISQEVDT